MSNRVKREDVKEVLACLGRRRRLFYYFKDRYCLDMIGYELQRQREKYLEIKKLKNGPLQHLTNRPLVNQLLANCGQGKISESALQASWPTTLVPLIVSLRGWGDGDRGWDQTSRNQCNLVLQINFDQGHAAEYKRLVKPVADAEGPFENEDHPIRYWGRHTLSWVRMDIEFDTNEVLIEEIQNDWLRYADRALRRINLRRRRNPRLTPGDIYCATNAKYEDFKLYVEKTLLPYKKIWAEASLCIAINFIKKELGIKTIYYHTYETGSKIKDVIGNPLRSLYTRLPKQFGFKQTARAPEFLLQNSFSRRCIKAIKNPQWFQLEM